MIGNIFMISDASYSKETKCAGLGVIDLYTGKKYTNAISDIDSSHDAEYRALLLSVQIAIKQNYQNVVFVYDNKALNLDSLKLWVAGKIHSCQFLWLKREFVKDADKLARKARGLYEILFERELASKKISDSKLISTFKNYSTHQIIRAFLLLANKDEYEILKTYIKCKKYPPVLVEQNSLDFYSDLYHLLPKDRNKKSFFKFIDKNYSGIIDVVKFKTPKNNEYYVLLIKKIVSKLQKVHGESIKKDKRLLSNRKYDFACQSINNLKTQSPKVRINSCINFAKGYDKVLLNSYFNAQKSNICTFNVESVKLFNFMHSILPEGKNKSNFYGFIKNRLKKDKKLKNLFCSLVAK